QHHEIGPFARLERPELSIELEYARRAASRSNEGLHRAQPGFDHQLELSMLIETLPPPNRRSGVGSQRNRDATVRQQLHVARTLLQRLFRQLGFFAHADFFLKRRLLYFVQIGPIHADAAEEER